MNSIPPKENEFESSVNIQYFLMIMLAIMVGVLTAIQVLPTWLPNMANSLSGQSPKIYWYLSRATAFVSLTILWVSMALGLGLSNKMARVWPGAPAAFAIHEYVSLLGLAFALFHAMVLLGDHYIHFTVVQIFLPFATTAYRPTWVGIGQIGFYVWLIVALSFYVRSSIGQKTWRVVHYLSFVMYLMGLIHGLFSGTDTDANWASWYYWISGGSLLILLAYRLYDSVRKKKISLPQFGRGRVPTENQNLKPSTPKPIVPTEKHLPEALVREQTFSTTASVDKRARSAVALSTVSPNFREVPAQYSQNEKTRPRASETPAPEGPSSSTVPPVIPDLGKKELSSPWIEKYEMGTGKDKINVRIFKEPEPEPVILEAQKNVGKKPAETLALRLKKDFTATPTRPRPLIPSGHSN